MDGGLSEFMRSLTVTYATLARGARSAGIIEAEIVLGKHRLTCGFIVSLGYNTVT